MLETDYRELLQRKLLIRGAQYIGGRQYVVADFTWCIITYV